MDEADAAAVTLEGRPVRAEDRRREVLEYELRIRGCPGALRRDMSHGVRVKPHAPRRSVQAEQGDNGLRHGTDDLQLLDARDGAERGLGSAKAVRSGLAGHPRQCSSPNKTITAGRRLTPKFRRGP